MVPRAGQKSGLSVNYEEVCFDPIGDISGALLHADARLSPEEVEELHRDFTEQLGHAYSEMLERNLRRLGIVDRFGETPRSHGREEDPLPEGAGADSSPEGGPGAQDPQAATADASRAPGDRAPVSDGGTATVQEGDGAKDTAGPLRLGDPLDVSEDVRSIGVPRGALPGVADVVGVLRELARDGGRTVDEAVWQALPQRLLSNYRYLLPRSDGQVSGLMIPMGGLEALVTLDPRDPHTVLTPDVPGAKPPPDAQEAAPAKSGVPQDTPAGASPVDGPAPLVPQPAPAATSLTGVGSINSVYHTGAESQRRGGQAGATRFSLAANAAHGLGPAVAQVLQGGVGYSGTANQTYRATTFIGDAEGGHVEDSRSVARLVAYRPHWTVRLRTRNDTAWSDVTPHAVWLSTAPGTALVAAEESRTPPLANPLLLYIPEHYLFDPPPRQVVAAGHPHPTSQVPRMHFASGLTNLPRLFDVTAAAFAQGRHPLALGSTERDELLQKLWNLDAYLDQATRSDGYPIWLHDRNGQSIARVVVRGELLSTVRVGSASSTAHLEDVRTAIVGDGSEFHLTQSQALSVFARIGLLPEYVHHRDAGLSFSFSLGPGASKTDTLTASRAGLWVVVPRYTGVTVAYVADLRFSVTVELPARTVHGGEQVPSRALLRMPQTDAYAHGHAVDLGALVPAYRKAVSRTGPDGGPHSLTYSPHHLPGGRTPAAEGASLPPYVLAGSGAGTSLVSVDDRTVREIRGKLDDVLRGLGYLQGEPLRRGAAQNSLQLQAQFHNRQLLEKYVSLQGFDSHFDQMHQDGLRFALHRRPGGMNVVVGAKTLYVTVKARKPDDRDASVLGVETGWHLVNLAMGMDTAGAGASGSRRLGAGLRAQAGTGPLRAGAVGFDVSRSQSAGQSAGGLTNMPKLVESAEPVTVASIPYDVEVTLTNQDGATVHSFTLSGQTAEARLLPLATRTSGAAQPTPVDVLRSAAIYYLDSTGLHSTAADALRAKGDPGTAVSQELYAFTSAIQTRAHFKEIVQGRYTTDALFESGFWRDTFAAVDISAGLGTSVFAGATQDKMVIGDIRLYLSQTFASSTRSTSVRWAQLDLVLGGATQPSDPDDTGFIQGGADAGRTLQWNTGSGEGRTSGKELIQLDFNHAYAYQTTVDYTVRTHVRKNAKLLPASEAGRNGVVPGRTAIYVLPEPQALEHYARGELPVPEAQLADALSRWAQGGLRLSGNTVAGMLNRWKRETAQPRPSGVQRAVLAELLAELHEQGAVPVLDPAVRTQFTAQFGVVLEDREDFQELTLPEYLTSTASHGRFLGHSGVTAITYDALQDGRPKYASTYDVVREQVEAAAPGLLAADAELWDAGGRRIGRLQGGVDALQALLVDGRDSSLWEDVLSSGGTSLYLVNPMGWALSDVVEVTLADELTTPPDIYDFRPGTGLENYGHGYRSTTRTGSRDIMDSVTVAKLGGGDAPADTAHITETGAFGVGDAQHSGVTRAENAVTEQTAYDWNGHYRVRFGHRLTVTVRRLDMAGRPLNNFAAGLWRKWTGTAAPRTVAVNGTLDMQLPRGVGDFTALEGPAGLRDTRSLPQLGHDSYVTGVLLDEVRDVAEDLLARLTARSPRDRSTRLSLTLAPDLSRHSLSNHLLEALSPQGYPLTPVSVAGVAGRRFRLTLHGRLADLQMLGRLRGTGTGRYAKHQSGTTASTSRDARRPGATATTSPLGDVALHNPATTPDGLPYPPDGAGGDVPLSRLTGIAQGAAGTENYRREQHAKQQGPVHLVRARGYFRLTAQVERMHLFGGPTGEDIPLDGGAQAAGDVYLELNDDEISRLRQHLEQDRPPVETAPPSWQHLRVAPRFDATALLAEVSASPGAQAARAHQTLASLIRRRTVRLGAGVVFDLDMASLSDRLREETSDWAVRMLSGLAETDPTGDIPAFLTRLGHGAERETEPDELIRTVDELRTRVLRGTTSRPIPPAELPQLAAFAALSPDDLARDLAMELATIVRVDVVGRDGRDYSRWAEPGGRLHAFDPQNPSVPGAGGLTLRQVEEARLLGDLALAVPEDDLRFAVTPLPTRRDVLAAARSVDLRYDVEPLIHHRLRVDIEALGIDLAAAYQKRWWRRSFAQTVQEEIDERMQRLGRLGPELRGLLRLAWHRSRSSADGVADTAPEALRQLRRLAAEERSTGSGHRDLVGHLADVLVDTRTTTTGAATPPTVQKPPAAREGTTPPAGKAGAVSGLASPYFDEPRSVTSPHTALPPVSARSAGAPAGWTAARPGADTAAAAPRPRLPETAAPTGMVIGAPAGELSPFDGSASGGAQSFTRRVEGDSRQEAPTAGLAVPQTDADRAEDTEAEQRTGVYLREGLVHIDLAEVLAAIGAGPGQEESAATKDGIVEHIGRHLTRWGIDEKAWKTHSRVFVHVLTFTGAVPARMRLVLTLVNHLAHEFNRSFDVQIGDREANLARICPPGQLAGL